MPTSPRNTSGTPEAAAGRRREAALVIGIVLLGLALRGLRPEAMAVEHFDEGVYASNLYCGHLEPPFAYPMRHLYAPPLFPALLEWAQIFAGPSAVMWVNVLLGSLMVLAVWWTTRAWFGRSAAIAAAMLAATSEYHIAFSRMALTDVPLSLFMLLGVYAGWKAILTGRPLWIAAAGLLAGLAWCTKYNGWLTLAVTGSGTAAAILVPRLLPTKTIANCELQIANCKLRQTIVRWAATTAIAAGIFWWFVVRELAPFGGYAAVATNHAGYFVGLAGWWSGLVRQAAAHEWIMGWPTCLGIAAAWLACDWTPGGPAVRGTDGRLAERADASGKNSVTRMASVVVVAIVLAFTAWLLTASGLLALAALSGFVGVWRRATIDRSGSQGAERAVGTQLAAWMLLAWFCGLLASVPLYYPYPRLSLPWVVVTWPLAGAALSLGWERVKRMSGGDAQQSASGAAHDSKSSPALVSLDLGSKSRKPKPGRRLMTVLLLSAAVGTGWLLLDRVFAVQQSGQSSIRWRAAWQSRDQVRPWFEMVRSEIGPEAEARASAGRDVSAVVYVAGDPAAFFQLSAANRIPGVVFLPIADPAGLKATTGVPTYLLTHVPAGGTESSAAHLIRTRAFYYRPSDLVMLDRRPASELRSQGAANDALRLHRIGAE